MRVAGLLNEASVLVVGYLGFDPTDTDPLIPDSVRIVTSRMVARVLEQSAPVEASSASSTAGPFGSTVQFTPGTTSRQPWLTRQDKITLRVLPGRSGIQSLAAGSEHSGYFRRIGN